MWWILYETAVHIWRTVILVYLSPGNFSKNFFCISGTRIPLFIMLSIRVFLSSKTYEHLTAIPHNRDRHFLFRHQVSTQRAQVILRPEHEADQSSQSNAELAFSGTLPPLPPTPSLSAFNHSGIFTFYTSDYNDLRIHNTGSLPSDAVGLPWPWWQLGGSNTSDVSFTRPAKETVPVSSVADGNIVRWLGRSVKTL
jgi:hypothetical protein